MDNLPPERQQQIKKMSDERLKVKLIEYGYREELVQTWEREEMIARFAEAVGSGQGARPKEPQKAEREITEPESESEEEEEVNADKPDMEFQRYELEKLKLKIEQQRIANEIERLRITAQKEKDDKDRELEKMRIDLEKQKLDDERKQKQLDDLARTADREADMKKHDAEMRAKQDTQNDAALKNKKYCDAVKGSIIPMGPDPLDAPVFFSRVEKLLLDLNIPKEYYAKIVGPYLSHRAQAILNRASEDIAADYDQLKATILHELKFSPSSYLERFNLCVKATDESFAAFASRLRNLLDYYTKSRDVVDFKGLCELLVCDRIKSTLSEGCLRYVLGIESGKDDKNWLSVKDLTSAVDRFVAAHGDAVKPKAYSLGQTPKMTKFLASKGGAGKTGNQTPKPTANTAGSNQSPGHQGGGASPQTPIKSVICYKCHKPGHVQYECPQNRSGGPGAGNGRGRGARFSVKRVAATIGNPAPAAESANDTAAQNSSDGPSGNLGTAPTATTASTNTEITAAVNRTVLVDNDDTLFDVTTVMPDTNVEKVVLCNSIAQISDLCYTDVVIKNDALETSGSDTVVRALVDSGSQICVINSNLVQHQNLESKGTMSLQPFCGNAVTADWVRLNIQAKSESGKPTKVRTIDCAMVPNLNENFIVTADVMSKLTQDINDAMIADVTATAVNGNTVDDDEVNDQHNDVSPSLVTTAQQTESNDRQDLIADEITSLSNASAEEVMQEQQVDETLKGCLKLAQKNKGGFVFKDKLLYHKGVVMGQTVLQLVVPKSRRDHVLEIAHNNFGGHMASRKTRERIEYTFYWPTLRADCENYVTSCTTCQLKRHKTKFDRVPINPIPRCDLVFQHMFLDCFGPLVSGDGPKPKFNYALVVVDSYSRFPFCVPLKSLTAKNVCEALFDIWSFTGICLFASSDLGTNFTSQLTQEFEKQLGCSPRFNSPYHPASTGLVERCVGSIKAIISKVAIDHPNQWHRYMPAIMWALREAVNSTTGVAPWTLVFGRVPTGPLSVLKNHWIGTEELPVSFGKTATEYLRDVQERLQIAEQYAGPHTEAEQRRYQKYHNLRSADKNFEVGEHVLVLWPDRTSSKTFSRWMQGKITAKRSAYSYLVNVNGVDKHFHANHLRKYHIPVASVSYDASDYDVGVHLCSDAQTPNSIMSCAVIYDEDDGFGDVQTVPNNLNPPINHELPSAKIDPDAIKHLSRKQQTELLSLLDEFASCFSEVPGYTDVVTHQIVLLEGFRPKRLPAYRVPERLKPEVSRQIKEMLDNGIIRPSTSPMASPLVCVLKGRDGCDGVRLAVDYRYVNKYTQNDSYPMNNLQSIFQSVSGSNLISVCDMKGAYWQIPCQESQIWLTAFICDDGIFEFTRCPFGMKNSGASFVRAVSQILSPVHDVAKNFVDDVAVHSGHWQGHLADLRRFFEVVQRSGLTLNLKKCRWAHNQVKFCGKIIGSGKILADPDKLSVVDKMCPPTTKREVRKALGFFGYFREHLPNYAEIAKPLTDLTTKQYKSRIDWGEPQQTAYDQLKRMLKMATENPLYTVDFYKPFNLFTDASNFSVSVAVTQCDDQGKHFPVAFSSQKLTETQRKWPVIEREAYAVLHALRKYRAWFLGNECISVYLDHNPLTFLVDTVPKSARLIRWALSLQEMPVRFQYYPGKKNVVADYLSRVETV